METTRDELPEVAQARALQRIADLGIRRGELLAALAAVDAELRRWCPTAFALGVTSTRIRELVPGLSQGTLYSWLPAEARRRRAPKRGRRAEGPASNA